MGTFIFILCVLIHFVYGADLFYHPWKYLHCPFSGDKLIGSNLSDRFQIEYFTDEDYIRIPCCQMYSANSTKRYIFRDRFFKEEERYDFAIGDETFLSIYAISKGRTGAYYCKDEFSSLNAFTYVYLIDIEEQNIPIIRGKWEAYQKYLNEYVNRLGIYLSTAINDDPYLQQLKDSTGLELEAGIRWDPWSECDFCAGEKTRMGRCHYRPIIVDETRWANCEGVCELYKNSLHMDCRSYWTVQRLFPLLANLTKNVPNFLAVAKCVGPCVSAVIPGYDYVKKLRTVIMNVGDSAVLSCPKYTRKKNCYWRKNGVKLTSNEYDPYKKVSINELCMLYLNYASKHENGNYTCYLNDDMIQQIKVIVEVQYSEVDKAWWRHVIYLLYVILLCFIILVAGILIGCLQRGNFRTVSAREMIEMYAMGRMEYEKLLPAE